MPSITTTWTDAISLPETPPCPCDWTAPIVPQEYIIREMTTRCIRKYDRTTLKINQMRDTRTVWSEDPS